ncbi:MAG: hypothetical protein AB1349_00675 [Elusimicrobiota bacterium]
MNNKNRWLSGYVIKWLVTTLLIHLSTYPLIHCLYDTTQSFSARELSLGGAYTALSDDATGINTNPAGISQLETIEFCCVYSPLYSTPSDCYYGLLASVVPFGYNTFGISFIRNSILNTYSENTYSVGYSRILKENIFVGFNIKALNITIPGYSKYNDPAYSGGKTAMGYDIGYLHKIYNWFSCGLSLQNINQPTIKLLSTSIGEELKPVLKTGLAFKPKNTIFVIDFDTEQNIYLGSEISFANFFALRLGLNNSRITSGFSVNFTKIKLDFGFLFHKQLGILYRTGITYKL